jgi:hypothetical protein
MAKEFNKKFMHPTRRKLVDMVLHGQEYETDTFVSFAGAEDNNNITRKVGDRWTDSAGNMWEQKEFGKMKVSDLSDTMQEVRQYLSKLNTCKSTECKTIKYGRVDKKLISKTGYCTKCLAVKEFQIKQDGLWDAYETYKITSNMICYGLDVVAKFKQAYSDAKQEYEFVGEDGKIEMWRMEKDIEELKAEILADIERYESEIQEAIKLRDGAWELLKDKNYDLVTAPNN